MAGHMGAAVVAGYFFGEEHADLDSSVSKAIENDLDRIMNGGESLWYDPKVAGITVPELFEPLPEERAREELIPTTARGTLCKHRRDASVRTQRHFRFHRPACTERPSSVCDAVHRWRNCQAHRGL